MNKALRIARRLGSMDYLERVAVIQEVAARVRTRLYYSLLFQKIGAGSWIKQPDRLLGASHVLIGRNVRIERGAILFALRKYFAADHEGNIRIGDGTYINRNFNATSAIGIDIGTEVAFGTNVFVCDFDHGYNEPRKSRISSPLQIKGPIRIGDRCWIGSNAYIASGVELGADCVVGANSVVTRSFPPGTVIAGSPAVAIRQFDETSATWRSCRPVHELAHESSNRGVFEPPC